MAGVEHIQDVYQLLRSSQTTTVEEDGAGGGWRRGIGSGLESNSKFEDKRFGKVNRYSSDPYPIHSQQCLHKFQPQIESFPT